MQCRETVTPHTSTGHCVIQLVFPQSLKIGVEKLQTFFFFSVIGRLVREPEEMQYESFFHCAHFFSFIKRRIGQKHKHKWRMRFHGPCRDVFAAAGVTTAGLWSGYVCLCCCSAEVSIVLRGKLCCWEDHSNWIVDKTSLSSALALLLMQVNNHLNGSCLLRWLENRGEEKLVAGVQHLNVNNLFFNACPAFRGSETC